jgi:hypothetical protein
LNADYPWLWREVIGMSGTVATGKTTASEYLSNRGYYYVRYSQVLQNRLKEEGIKSAHSSLQKVGWQLHEEQGQLWPGQKVSNLIDNQVCAVIDGLRFPDDHALMSEVYGSSFLFTHQRFAGG